MRERAHVIGSVLEKRQDNGKNRILFIKVHDVLDGYLAQLYSWEWETLLHPLHHQYEVASMATSCTAMKALLSTW